MIPLPLPTPSDVAELSTPSPFPNPTPPNPPPHQPVLPNSPATFSFAEKQITIPPNSNVTLLNYTCADPPCLLSHMWFGGAWDTYDRALLSVEVDHEPTPAIAGQLFLMHGIGFADPAAPWSAGALFGKTAQPSGVFNTFKIPFASSLVIRFNSMSSSPQPFWFIFRGTSATPLPPLGHIPLPPSARLRLYTHHNIQQAATTNLTLVSTPKAGAVLLTTLSVSSANENFLEGEVRAFLGPQRSLMPLSSGTEDYFVVGRGEFMDWNLLEQNQISSPPSTPPVP